jgi:ABC transport system ATP-binding/permease protein
VPHGTPPPGTIKRAEQLRVVLFSQHRSEIDQGITLAEALSPHSDGVVFRGQMLHINTWARKFLFSTQQLKQPVRALSGGEQARIHIARLMLEPADVLILDEPTNDLDIPSLEVLEESLEDFPGSVVLVTHDRAMLARLCTQFVALDGQGGATHHADYEQWERAHEQARAASLRDAKARSKASTAQAPSTATQSTPTEAPKKGKLSYKEQRELEQIEPAILENEALVSELETQLHASDVARDPRKLHDVSSKLGEAQARVAQLYERWTQLEAKQRGE